MNISTVINHESRIKQHIRDVFRRAKHFCWSSKELNEAYAKEILKSAVHARLPRYSKSFLQGYNEALRDEYWNNVKWVLPYGGGLFNKFDDLPEEGKAFYRSVRDTPGFHVYKSNEKKHFTGVIENYQTGVKDA